MGVTRRSWARTAVGSIAIVFAAGTAFAAEPAKTVTFTKDVAPKAWRRCHWSPTKKRGRG